MKASEAKVLADTATNVFIQIMDRIVTAASKNEYDIQYRGVLTPLVKQSLLDLGYCVAEYAYGYKISWEHPKD